MGRYSFDCIDAHTCGNPVRVIKNGEPHLQGNNMNAKRLHFIENYDWMRKGLMFEPRGHDMMSGSMLYPPHDPNHDLGVLFIETSGCLPMCGHGLIGTITVVIEEALITPKSPGHLKVETPAGLINVEYEFNHGKVNWVKLTNVKSYLAAQDLVIESADLGLLSFDVAYGGNFYAIIDPQSNFSGLEAYAAGEIIKFSQEIRTKINEAYPNHFIHPEEPSIKDVTHIQWTGVPLHKGSHGRNAVFYGDKAIDRSPCGTGTSARMAQLYAKGKLNLGETYIHESYIGSTFKGCIEAEGVLKDKVAIIPSITGWAKIFGYNTLIIDDEDDPYAHGFQVI